MKHSANQDNGRLRLAKVWITAGIILLVSGIFIGQALGEKLADLGSNHGPNKVTAGVRAELQPARESYFSVKDLERLAGYSNGNAYACLSRSNTLVSTDFQSVTAAVNGVNYLYPQFHRLELKSGVFFTATAQMEQETVAVIDKILAVKLFNTENPVGNEITLFNHRFKIIGIVAPDSSIVGTLTDSGIPDIYIPINLLAGISPETLPAYLEMSTNDTSATGENRDNLVNALQTIGKDPNDYKIIDYNIEKIFIDQKPQLLVMLLCLTVIFKLVFYLKNRFQSVVRLIREDCRNCYLRQALRINKKLLTGLLLKLLLVSGGILTLWKLAVFNLYIPAEYVPDELFDLQYFTGLFKGKIQTAITSTGYIPAPQELVLEKMKMLSNLAFYGGLLGFFLLNFGIRRFCQKETRLTRSILTAGLLFIASVVVTVIVASFSGLPVSPGLNELIVVWTFIFISFVFSKDSKKKHNDIKAKP